MNIDCIILTKTSDERFYSMTCQTINTLLESEPSHQFHIKLIESNYSSAYNYVYPNIIETLKPVESFNYNRFLNFGLDLCTSDWIIISNNDVIYTPGWLTTLLAEHEKDNDLLSMCPYEPKWHSAYYPIAVDVNYGYNYKTFVTGWCIVANKKVFQTIGKLDERFPFWYQDDDYGLTLQKYGIKHAMVKNSIVYHLNSQSHVLLNSIDKHALTFQQESVFKSKWKS